MTSAKLTATVRRGRLFYTKEKPMATRSTDQTAPKVRRFTKRVTGLLPIRKLEIGEEITCEIQKIKKAKLGELIHVLDIDTGEVYALSGYTSLLNMLEEGKAYRIKRVGDQRNENTGRTYFGFEVFEEEG
jgi:hypothetical protein